jgi:hypothetical protein
MKRFDRVKEILEDAINREPTIDAHGPFWRPLTLAAFKVKKVYNRQLVIPGDGAKSNLILALRGQAPFGVDLGTEGALYSRMPAGFPPVPDDRIAFIEQWITDGCPDDEVPQQEGK